jgi:hypothetical protein
MRGKCDIARIAARQHGLITRKQLLDIGMKPSAIDRRIDQGWLIAEYRGVYRVGHAAPSTEAAYMAAVLAAGKDALLSGRAAAHLMRLLKGTPPDPEVVAPGRRSVDGLDTSVCRNLHPRDATTFRGIRCTTIARTLVDLAGLISEDALARAVHQASVLYRTQPEDINAVLKRRPNAKGAAVLREIVHGDTKLSLSRLEKRFLELCRENNFELPQTNKNYGGRYVDCRWPARKLTVELDSYRYHATRHAWELDRKREREARARGDDFRRYTSDDVFEDPRALLRELGFLRK